MSHDSTSESQKQLASAMDEKVSEMWMLAGADN